LIGLETSLGLRFGSWLSLGLLICLSWLRKCRRPSAHCRIKKQGIIKQDYDADITIIDENKEWVVTEQGFQSKSRIRLLLDRGWWVGRIHGLWGEKCYKSVSAVYI